MNFVSYNAGVRSKKVKVKNIKGGAFLENQ